jgi:hypothetical protein
MSPKPVARATNLTDAIRANLPMVALLRAQKQPGEVENVMLQLAEDQIGFVRVRNPLITSLSVERLVLQITGDDVGEGLQDNLERVRRALVARSTMGRQIAVVVEQAETLTPEALEFLHGLPGLSDPSLAPVQVALVGSSALGARLADSRAYIIRNPAEAVPASAIPAPTIVPQETRPNVSRKRRPRSEIFLLASLVLFGGGDLVYDLRRGPARYHSAWPDARPHADASAFADDHERTTADRHSGSAGVARAAVSSPAVQPVAELPIALEQASPQVPPLEPPLPEPPMPPLEQAATDRARLYREFTAFLDTSVIGKRLSRTEREALLQEYLARHQATLSSQTAGQTVASTEVQAFRIPGEPRVLLFFAAGSDRDLAAAEREAELLRDRVAGIELQPVSAVPGIPTIRYKFPTDRTAALALAQTTLAPGGAWQVEDTTTSPKRPEPGTIECGCLDARLAD